MALLSQNLEQTKRTCSNILSKSLSIFSTLQNQSSHPPLFFLEFSPSTFEEAIGDVWLRTVNANAKGMKNNGNGNRWS
jgi:hypothetical protein